MADKLKEINLPIPKFDKDLTLVNYKHTMEMVETALNSMINIVNDIQVGQLIYTPEITGPSISGNYATFEEVEIGEEYSRNITFNFDRGSIQGALVNNLWDISESQGHRAGELIRFELDGSDIGTDPNVSIGPISITSVQHQFVFTAFYGEGIQPKNSKDEPYGDPLPEGSISTTLTIASRRRSFFGHSNDADNSETIRNLQTSTLGLSAGDTFDISIPVGATNVVFAYPANLGDNPKVMQYQFNITGQFTKTTVNVEGANGYNAIEYNVFVYTPNEPFLTSEVYSVEVG